MWLQNYCRSAFQDVTADRYTILSNAAIALLSTLQVGMAAANFRKGLGGQTDIRLFTALSLQFATALTP